MKRFADAIFEAEKHSKQAEKFPALSGLVGDDLTLVKEALNPYRVFGVKKFDLPQVYSNVDADYSHFLNLLDCLQSRQLTGNSARDSVTAVLGMYTERTAEALIRVLLKDLKCGASESTFEKIYPNEIFPKFELMLAKKIEERAQALRPGEVQLTPALLEKKYKLKFPLISDQKLDGNRLLCSSKNGIVEYKTRSGKIAEYCQGIFDAELNAIEKYVGEPIVLDGEALARSFQETCNAKKSTDIEAKSHLRFYAFDWMTLDQWERNAKTEPQYRRSAQILQFIEILNLTKIVKVKSKICHSIKELKEFNEEVLRDGINADGSLNGQGEGLIIKNFNGHYEWDRSTFWFKWKPIIDVDLKIVGFYKGKAGTKNEDKLGGMILEGQDENGNQIKTDTGGFKVTNPVLKSMIEELAKKQGIVGSAFEEMNKDQFFRQYVWNHQDEFLGKTAMIEGQELSLAEDAEFYAVRFPQFACIRDDK